MRAETQNTIEAIRKSLSLLAKRMDWETAKHRLEEFDAMIEDPNLWNDQERAQKLMRDRQQLLESIATYETIDRDLTDNVELIEMGEAEDDKDIVSEAEVALKALREKAGAKELEALLDGEADANDTYLEINAGAGGTESCDWASMLARMYVRWAEKKGYKVELTSESAGEEAGIKSAAYKISGHNAYGWLKSESGFIGWCAFRPMTARRGGIPRSPRFGCIRWLMTTSKLTCPTKTSALIPIALRGLVVSTSTPPTRRCGLRTTPPGSW